MADPASSSPEDIKLAREIITRQQTILTRIQNVGSRAEVTHLLTIFMPSFVLDEDWLNNLPDNEQHNLKENMRKLQEVICQDFIASRKSDWITLLVRYNLSPIAIHKINEYTAVSSTPHVAANILKRFWLDKCRHKSHSSIFYCSPQSSTTIFQIPDTKIRSIVFELAANNQIINRYVHHWTTVQNLKNIIRNGAFYGNRRLKDYAIPFSQNTLAAADIKNGDDNVICFSPCLVDQIALVGEGSTNRELRADLIRLTIDLSSIDRNKSKSRYQQFFKLFDFLTPNFKVELKITEDLTVKFEKKSRTQDQHVDVHFSLGKVNAKATIDKKEAIFYGNLYAINRYCLIKVFELVQKAGIAEQFRLYLLALTNDEIKKVLTLFCQAMTMFSEYNFYNHLPLSANLITEIYFANDNKLLGLSAIGGSYDKFLNSNILTERNDLPLAESKHARLSRNSFGIMYGGIVLSEHMTIIEDFSTLPSNLFDSNYYLETRFGKERLLQLFQDSFPVTDNISSPCPRLANTS